MEIQIDERAIAGLRNEFRGIANVSHLLHALLSDTLLSMSNQQLNVLLENKEIDICISDSMVLDFLDSSANSDLNWLNDLLETIGLEKGMQLVVYKFQPDDEDPILYPHVLSIDLIDDDDYLDFLEDEFEEAQATEAIAVVEEKPKAMAAGA